MAMRYNVVLKDELKEIVVADAALIIAFSFALTGGIGAHFSNNRGILYVLPIVAVGVTLSFVLHELMHKYVAQHYGAIAGFKTSSLGLAITLITGLLGTLFGIPGATMIYVHSFTKRENGLVSLAGPLTNFVVFAAAISLSIVLNLPTTSYIYSALSFTIFISLLLAFFNMLPIMPLDGAKVLAWSKEVYATVMGVLLVLIVYFNVLSIGAIIYLLAIALFFSLFYRNLF